MNVIQIHMDRVPGEIIYANSAKQRIVIKPYSR